MKTDILVFLGTLKVNDKSLFYIIKFGSALEKSISI